jgi:hypothetical protein
MSDGGGGRGRAVRSHPRDLRQAVIAPGSVGCILTDQPYPREYLDCFSWLADEAVEWLTRGGHERAGRNARAFSPSSPGSPTGWSVA